MSLRQLLRKPLTNSRPRFPQTARARHQSTNSSSNPSTTSSFPHNTPPSTQTSRFHHQINKLNSRLPKFLHPYTQPLLNAPLSHLLSFLILHELTAIVPLIGLASLFHYTNWLPKGWVEGKWVSEGVERFGKYFGRKGWFGFSPPSTRAQEGATIRAEEFKGGREEGGEVTVEGTEKRWAVGEKGGRILVEVATAYAVTKVLLPVRIILSVWGTPWFARVFVGRFMGVFGRSKGANKGAIGIGASAGGVGGAVGKVGEGVKKMPP